MALRAFVSLMSYDEPLEAVGGSLGHLIWFISLHIQIPILLISSYPI